MEFIKKHARKHAQKLKFGIVGVLNTLIDFVILFVLVHLGLDKIPANFISTGIAFIFSFIVNKSFTFKSNSGDVRKQFILFILITMTGLWIIQPLIITIVSMPLSSLIGSGSVELLIAKLVASVASLIWNYLFYSRLVFKKGKAPEQVL